MAVWNPWHGCKKISAGCDNCYVYEKDAMYGKNASVIRRTANFDLPVKKNRRGEYKLLPQEEPVYVCMTSDFFLPEADEWRSEAWAMIKERQDLSFVIETKRRACMRFCLGAGTDEPVRELRGYIPLFADRHFFPEREPDIPDRGGGTGRAGEAGRRGLHAITRGGMTG